MARRSKFQTYLSPDVRQLLERLAEETGLSKPELVERALVRLSISIPNEKDRTDRPVNPFRGFPEPEESTVPRASSQDRA